MVSHRRSGAGDGAHRGPDEPAAHVSDYLALLPSGPDAVRRLKLHRVRAAVRPVTTRGRGQSICRRLAWQDDARYTFACAGQTAGYARRDVGAVERARLESVCRGNSTVGSNPTLSAIFPASGEARRSGSSRYPAPNADLTSSISVSISPSSVAIVSSLSSSHLIASWSRRSRSGSGSGCMPRRASAR